MKPDLRFLVSHPAHLVALGFGSGLAPVAPGTFGSLLGWASFVWLAPRMPLWAWIALLIVGFAAGCWFCAKTGRDLGAADHGAMVWDEIIAMWLVLLCTPAGIVWQAFAFVLFRAFDIVKPPPIRLFEQRFKPAPWSGFGVMGDDLIAAVDALLVMAVFVRWLQ